MLQYVKQPFSWFLRCRDDFGGESRGSLLKSISLCLTPYLPGGSRQRTLQFLSHPLPRRFPLRSYLWQYSIRTWLLQMRSWSMRRSWSLLSNICYVTALFMSPSFPSYVPILLLTAIHLSTCMTQSLPSRKGQLIWVSIWLQAVFLTSANLRALSRLGKQPKSWLRPNFRQTLLRKHMVFQLPSYRVIGPQS